MQSPLCGFPSCYFPFLTFFGKKKEGREKQGKTIYSSLLFTSDPLTISTNPTRSHRVSDPSEGRHGSYPGTTQFDAQVNTGQVARKVHGATNQPYNSSSRIRPRSPLSGTEGVGRRKIGRGF